MRANRLGPMRTSPPPDPLSPRPSSSIEIEGEEVRSATINGCSLNFAPQASTVASKAGWTCSLFVEVFPSPFELLVLPLSSEVGEVGEGRESACLRRARNCVGFKRGRRV